MSRINLPDFSKTPPEVLKFMIHNLVTQNNILKNYIDVLDVAFCICCQAGVPATRVETVECRNCVLGAFYNMCGECQEDDDTKFCKCENFYHTFYLTSSVPKIHMAADKTIYCDDCLTDEAEIVEVIDQFENQKSLKVVQQYFHSRND